MSPKSIPASQLLDALRWRYATKAFDANRKISADVWSALEEIYAVRKTEGELHAQLRGWINNGMIFFIICYAGTTMATRLDVPHMAVRVRANP